MIPEELVEEVAEVLADYYNPFPPFDGVREGDREIARQTITHVGKVVLGGEYPKLDELLGVVGRRTIEESPQVGWMGAKYAQGARTFIALSPTGILPGIPGTGAVERKEGTGKEGEG